MSVPDAFNPECHGKTFLSKLEDQTLSNLREKRPSISSSEVSRIEEYFLNAKDAYVRISEVSLRDLWASQWALLGINQRAYQLTMATLQQMNEGNYVACGHSIRGILETLSAVLWVEAKPDRLSSLVEFQAVSIGKMMSSSFEKYPILKNKYKYWSLVTHPGRNSNLLCPPSVAVTEKGMIWPITFGFSDSFASEIINDLIPFCGLINIHIDLFITLNEEVLRSGKLVLKGRKKESGQ